jgi:hypothetical protein
MTSSFPEVYPEPKQPSDNPATSQRSPLGVLAEIVAIVESYGSAGVWLSRASPLIAKARLACLDNRLAVAHRCGAELEGAHPGQVTALRLCLRDLTERIEAAREFLSKDGLGTEAPHQKVAQLNALRQLLDAGDLSILISGLAGDRQNTAHPPEKAKQ